MKRAICVRILVMVGAMVAGAIGVQELRAQPIATTLVQKVLAGVEGKEVIIKHVELHPGYVGSRHFHPGPVFVYVIEGEFTVDTEKGRQTFKVGEVYEEPLGGVMQGWNLSTTNPTKLVVFQVGDKGKPFVIHVK